MAVLQGLINSIRAKKRVHGQSLIELLLAIAFAGIVLPALLTVFLTSREGKAQQGQRIDATLLFTEAQEALRSIRERGWSFIATNGTYHPVLSGNAWSLINGTETVSGFTRSIVISDVFRNSAGAIVSTGGTLDYSTKRVVITVSWTQPLSSSVSTTLYLTRYLGNNGRTQTTQSDFSAGSGSGLQITNTSGGEILLAPSGKANWCKPDDTKSVVDLPKSGVANAVSAVIGNVVAGTGENASGISFASVGVDNNSPPSATVSGTFDGYKTNAVFTDGHYAYIATDNNSKEVVILDLTQKDPITQKYVEVGYFNAPGNINAQSVYVATTSANIGFVATSDSKLYAIDLSSKLGSRPQLASKNLPGVGTKVIVNGNYAYVSVAGSTQELQIVQFNAAGTTLTITGYSDVNGVSGQDVALNNNATRAYLATSADSTKNELFVIDTSGKTGNRSVLGSYEANGMSPKGIAYVTFSKLILVGTGGEEYQAVDITNENTPSRCGGIQINTGAHGISGVNEPDEESYSYVISGDASSELKIIAGGPGGTYVANGELTSSIMDLGSDVVLNHISATVQKPAQTDVKFQIAIAKAVSNSCAGVIYQYVGPDGTSSTYFPSTGGSIAQYQNGGGYENPGRCVRYKAFLSTTDPDQSPTIFDVSINYSP